MDNQNMGVMVSWGIIPRGYILEVKCQKDLIAARFCLS